MKNFVGKTIEELKRSNPKLYDIERLKESCIEDSIPKEFFSENINDIGDELKAFTLGCEVFKNKTNNLYNGNNLETENKIKEAGVYQFLQATLQDKIDSIVSDTSYLKKLLELNRKDIEESITDSNKSFNLEIERYSTVGLVRDVNQDNSRIYQKNGLIILIVADGVGGGEDGDVASKLACDTSIKYLAKQNYNVSNKEVESYLTQAILESHNKVREYADKKEIETIGTTLSIALVYNQKFFIGHVGDSRIYRIHNRDIQSITDDHSLPEVLYEKGDITKEEKDNYKKNILVYVVGKKGLKAENLHVFTAKDLKNDALFLCSDGVWDLTIHNDKIKNKFNGNIEHLKETIRHNLPTDNATFIRCRFENMENSYIHIDIGIEKKPNFIQELNEKPSYLKRFLPIFLAFLVFSVGYILYNASKTPRVSNIDEFNQTTHDTEANITTIDSKNRVIENNITASTNVTKVLSQQTDISTSKHNKEKSIETKKGLKEEAVGKGSLSTSLVKENSIVTKSTNTSENTTTVHSASSVTKENVPKSKIILDTTSYTKSDILIIDDMKIWFSEDKIMSTKRCFGTLLNTEQKTIRCKLKKQIINPTIVDGLLKQKFAQTIKIGWHEKSQESHIVLKINNNYKFIKVEEVNAPDHVEDVIFEKIEKDKVEKEVNPITPKIKHWDDSDALYLEDTLITFKKDKITLRGEDSSCHQEGNKWICLVLNKAVNYENITTKLLRQEFAEKIELNSDLSKQNTRIVVTLKKGYELLKNSLVNENCVLSFHKK